MPGLFVTVFLMTGAAAFAQAPATAPAPPSSIVAEPEQDIVVIGLATPYRIAAGPLRKAQKTYAKGRATAAPGSTLFFRISGVPTEGLALTLRDGDAVIALPIDAAGRVVLPDLATRDWTLVANRTRGTLQLRPLVMSTGTTMEDRRLGDLRLECAVKWAVAPDVPFPVRAMFNAAGGCRSSRIAFYFKSPQPVAAASVTAADGTVTALPVRPGGTSYRPPLSDRTLSDDMRVAIRFVR